MHANPKPARFFRIDHKRVRTIAKIFVVFAPKGQLPTHVLTARLGNKAAHSDLATKPCGRSNRLLCAMVDNRLPRTAPIQVDRTIHPPE